MYNLFIVRTPLQILNAYEASQHFKTTKNILVIIHNSQNNNLEQIEKVINTFELNATWEKVIEIEETGKSKFFHYIKLVKLLQQNQYETIFIGNFGSVYRLLLANLDYQQSYLVDDGTSTLVAHKIINRDFHRRSVKLKELRFLLFGLRAKMKKNINFFTIFNLKQINDEIIIKHTFKNVKKRFLSHTHYDETIYFLGQNLTQVNIVSKEKYLYYIEQIITKYSDKKIIYIPHRAEISYKEIQELTSDNFIIKDATMPIEMFFLVNRIYPKHVISFFSSALYTLNVIFNESKIEAFEINIDDVDEKVNNVKLCQDFLESTSVIKSPLESYKDYCLK